MLFDLFVRIYCCVYVDGLLECLVLLPVFVVECWLVCGVFDYCLFIYLVLDVYLVRLVV